MGNTDSRIVTRRRFLARAGAAAAGFALIPSSARGSADRPAPGNRITLGCIGVGRMGLGDMEEFLGFPMVQVLAVCDVDAKRRERAKEVVEKRYASARADGTYHGCATYGDYRELVARDDIDAVLICTPDHWHALPALAAAKAGKDVYLEKPLSYSIAEGRALSDTVQRYGRVFQTGSQQRSDRGFRFACELVRNGRIGKVHTVKVGLEGDPSNRLCPPMPVPPNLDYETWLGPAPWAPYTEERCHPQDSYDRPGWLRMKDYSGGMMTGWGAHHNDIAQWGLGTDLTGPVAVEGHGVFPRDGLWDVHGGFHVEYTYASGVKVVCSSQCRAGVTFEGSDGWVWGDRGALDAHPKALLKTMIGPDEIRLYESNSHKGNFIECIRTRKPTAAPAEIGHRSCTVCLLGNIAMELGRKLRWDPDRERFIQDPEADRLIAPAMRPPWRI